MTVQCSSWFSLVSVMWRERSVLPELRRSPHTQKNSLTLLNWSVGATTATTSAAATPSKWSRVQSMPSPTPSTLWRKERQIQRSGIGHIRHIDVRPLHLQELGRNGWRPTLVRHIALANDCETRWNGSTSKLEAMNWRLILVKLLS